MEGFRKRRGSQWKPGANGSGGSSGMGALLGYMIAQQKSGNLQQQLGKDAIVTGGRDPSTGATYTTPQGMKAEADVQSQIQTQKTIAEKTPERLQLLSNIKRMKALFDQVERPKPGLFQRFGGKTKNYLDMKGQTGSGIFSDQFEDLKKSIAGNVVRIVGGETGARLSDFDIKRVLGVNPDILGDTADRGRLGWASFSDMIDDSLESYGTKRENVAEAIFDKKNLGRARVLQGIYPLEKLDDEMLVGAATVDDVKSLPRVTREKLLLELKRRKSEGQNV